MTAGEFKALAKRIIETQADECARINGVSRERSLDDLRFHAGWVQGMLYASRMLDDVGQMNDEQD
jgi:hypothetical protein